MTKQAATQYNTYTLADGLRIIHMPSESPVVYCGYGIRAGTRDESPGEEGLAHFCEHTTFKGTQRRNAMQILNCLESVGGDLNAFTNKESTFYHAAVLKEFMPRAVSLLTDIVFASTYPQHEIDKEKAVICDEIECYDDTPAELIYDEFENMLFQGHPLGHNVLGNAEHLSKYTSADALRFTRRHYRPGNAIFFAYGDISFKRLVAIVERCRARQRRAQEEPSAKSGGQAVPAMPLEAAPHGRMAVQHRGTHQAHVMTGRTAYGAHDKRRFPLFILNNILGGSCMNARLNVTLRERHGLVYTVESAMVNYSDTGLWAAYFGCDHGDVHKCLRLARHEFDRLMQKPLSPAQLERAKRQLKGQIGVAADSREGFALSFAKTFLLYGHGYDITRLCERIDEVTPAQIQDTAQEILDPTAMTTLVFE